MNNIVKEIRDFDHLIRNHIQINSSHRKELSFTQFRILVFLNENKDKEICQKDLEIETHLKKASITGALDSLEDKGLVERKSSSEDKRRNIIVLTNKMNEIKDSLDLRVKQIEEIMKKDISKEELEQFHKTIEKMKNNLKEGTY